MLLPLVILPLSSLPTAQGACSFVVGPGNDRYVCDSASAPSLTDTSGNNSLAFPTNGTGRITGNVTFGNGQDSIDMASGSIDGNVNQGGGIDRFSMSGGVIVGNLNQGDGLDLFQMTGGWIRGTFDSGDFAEMDAGRIGNVNMRLDENTFILRGGSIDQNIITGFDTDFVEVFAGSVGGNISVSGGDDQVLVHGGQLGGNVLMSTGNDRFTWDGGRIGGQLDMGPGNDAARLQGLAADVLGITLDGGTGSDSLLFSGSHARGGGAFLNWEQIALSDASRLDLEGTLQLGDLASGTGALDIDSSSTLGSRLGVVSALDTRQRVSVTNAGTLDLTSGNDALGRLTVIGDYHGANGRLRVNTLLASDDAPSDRLVVRQGSLSGSTRIQVLNLGGPGAATTQDGIRLVEALDGATSSPDAFRLDGPVSAGAYDYQLFKGGSSPASENDWFLRSTLVQAGPAADIPLYRPEVPVYAAAPRGAALIVRLSLGTFHQRQGDQRALAGSGLLPASWGQAYGGELRQQWTGTVSPSLDGDLQGLRVGQDLYASVSDAHVRNQAGFYLGHSRLNAHVQGFALGLPDNPVGRLQVSGDSVGAYWTRVGAQGGYVDGVLQYTALQGHARSDRGGRLNIDGHAWSASLEAGIPIALSSRWSLEPQAQLIAQKVSLDRAQDRVSRVEPETDLELSARLGLRLEGTFAGPAERWLQPYAQVDVWHTGGGHDTLVFDSADQIDTDYRQTTLHLESGVLVQASQSLTLHGGVQYSQNLDGREQRTRGINLGLRWQF
jgi:outer membrane autotransporter protein